jgi:hypothetical protein
MVLELLRYLHCTSFVSRQEPFKHRKAEEKIEQKDPKAAKRDYYGRSSGLAE